MDARRKIANAYSARIPFLAGLLLALSASLPGASARDVRPAVPGVYSIRLDGSDRRSLGFEADFIASGPKGRILFIDGTRLGVAREDGTDRRILGRYRPWPGSPDAAWSPDGRWIAVLRGRNCEAQCYPAPTWLVDSKTGEAHFLARDCVGASWSPDGKRIACWRYLGYDAIAHSDRLDVFVFRLGDRQGQRIAHGCCLAWSPRGDEIFYRDRSSYLLRAVRPDGKGDRKVGVGWRNVAFSVSPDGKRLGLIAGRSGPFYDDGIFVIPTRGTRVLKIDTRPYSYGDTGATSITWSADGRRLAWAVGLSPGDQVRVARADGTGRARQITRENRRGGQIDSVTFSADGSRVIYTLR
jgi:Tol biopolymer transport system component